MVKAPSPKGIKKKKKESEDAEDAAVTTWGYGEETPQNPE